MFSRLCHTLISKCLAKGGDENQRNRTRCNTKLFRPSLEVPHSRARRIKKHNVIVLILSQLYCLEMGRGFRFLNTIEVFITISACTKKN